MHDRLDDALLQYRLLKGKIGQVSDQELTQQIVGWLAEAVCPIVDELVDSESFRESALWPLLNLTNGAESEARTVLCELESNIVELAQLLVDVGWETSDLPLPPVTVNWSANPNAAQLSVDELHQRVMAAAKQPWWDLVNPVDYFSVYSGLNISEPYDYPELRLEPHLAWSFPLLGDQITRFALRRIDFWMDAVFTLMDLAAARLTQFEFANVEKMMKLRFQIDELRKELDVKCAVNRFGKQPEGCITLTLIYVAYSVVPSVDWLSFPAGYLDVYPEQIRRLVASPLIDFTITDRVAAALEACTGLYRNAPEWFEVIEEAAQQYPLVLDLTSERFYWNGKEFNGGLSAKSWQFFSTLVEKQKTIGRGIEADDLGCGNKRDNLKVQKSRCSTELQKHFPELASLIVADRNTYRLNLDASGIKIFSRQVAEKVWELVARSQVNPLAEHSQPN